MIPCFAPSKEAAELEGSKAFAKAFMQKYNIPTPKYQVFPDFETAASYVEHGATNPIAIKACGTTSGQGILTTNRKTDAIHFLQSSTVRQLLGPAGSTVIIEECLVGEEISVLTLSDGQYIWSFPPGQNHKRAGVGNKGPYTGGMGVYSPVKGFTSDMMGVVNRTILKPTFEGLRFEGERTLIF